MDILLKLLVVFILVAYLLFSANCGLVDKNKADLLSKLSQKHVIPFILINQDNIKSPHNILQKLQYPIIFKPNVWGAGGRGVELIENEKQAFSYIQTHPGKDIIAQVYVKNQKEYSILIEKYPLSNEFYTLGVVEKIPISPNKSKFEPINLGYTKRKAHAIDYTKEVVTDDFNKLINEITTVPNFYVGRYDVKAKDLNNLRQGNFSIIELNGVIGTDHRSYVHTIKDFSFINLPLQLRWLFKRLFIGFQCNLIYNPIYLISNISNDLIYIITNDTKRFLSMIYNNTSTFIYISLSLIVINLITQSIFS